MIHLYYHTGSSNHGCEAIVRSTVGLFEQPMKLWSLTPDADYFYGLDKIIEICEDKARPMTKKDWKYYLSAVSRKLTGSDYRYIQFEHAKLRQAVKPGDICLSVGGDNYCYSGVDILGCYNRMLKARGAKSVLWGCSIEPEIIKGKVEQDLKRYDLITVRESLSYEGLISRGIKKNVFLCADPAFLLETADAELKNGFRKDNTIGINISPLVTELSPKVWDNYVELIRFILNETTDNIMFIPHVVKTRTDDRSMMRKMETLFKGNPRVVFIDDDNCMRLKGFISQCRVFVGARTHSVIAAYSSCVPTLAVGYSIKSKGIAKDIFGSYEKYVISVQDMDASDALVNAYKRILASTDEIKDHLLKSMPAYKQKAAAAAERIKMLGI